MITDSTQSHLSPAKVLDRLKTVMAAEQFEILESSSSEIRFRHGAYFSSIAPSFPKRGQFPKRGRILIQPSVNGSQIEYEIEVYGMIRYWLFFISIACCWLIFPPILAYQALSYQPHQMIRKVLQVIQ